MLDIIKPGLYRHFKGELYRVIDMVLDSDTGETKILYQNKYNDYYCRTLEEWVKPAQDYSGNEVERYRWVSN